MVHVEVKEQVCVWVGLCTFEETRNETMLTVFIHFITQRYRMLNLRFKIKQLILSYVVRVYQTHYYIRVYRISITIKIENHGACWRKSYFSFLFFWARPNISIELPTFRGRERTCYNRSSLFVYICIIHWVTKLSCVDVWRNT